MKEESIYQQALAHAIEQAANSQIAVSEHLRRLAFMKAERVFMECIGYEYDGGKIGTAKVIAVGYKTNDSVFQLDKYNNTKKAVAITVVFAADVDALIESKLKQLTAAERKDLKEIKSMRKDADYCKKNPWYREFSKARCCEVEKFRRINDGFGNRKNALKVLELATWTYSLSEVLSEKFIDEGMNYNGQTICSTIKA